MLEQTLKDLQEISKHIPKEWLQKLYKEVPNEDAKSFNEYIDDQLKYSFDVATMNGPTPERLKETRLVMDEKIAKKINDWLEQKTKSYIKRHRKEFEENSEEYRQYLVKNGLAK